MQLPFQKSFELMQTKWKSILDPVIKNPLNDVSILKSVTLIIGETKIPHLLGQVQRGWLVLDVNASATIYRSKPFDGSYLYLTSNAVATVSLGVF